MNPSENEPSSLLLISADPLFADLLAHASALAKGPKISPPVPATLAVESARASLSSPILVDLDSIEPQETLRLVAKFSLISEAPILLTSANAIGGSPTLDPLFQAGATACLLKPQGRSSLSLASSAGQAFIEQLSAALCLNAPSPLPITHDLA